MKKLFFFLIVPFLLVACGPPLVFGIPQDQWDQLSPQQRNQVIAGYNQRKYVETQLAPLSAVADVMRAKE